MSLEPKLLALYKDAKERAEVRRKDIEDAQARIETMDLSPSEKTASDILRIISTETIKRDQEALGILVLFAGIARYIDKLQEAMSAIQERLQQIGGTESKILEIEQLAKKHDEFYQVIDKMIQKGAEARDKEIPYVQ